MRYFWKFGFFVICLIFVTSFVACHHESSKNTDEVIWLNPGFISEKGTYEMCPIRTYSNFSPEWMVIQVLDYDNDKPHSGRMMFFKRDDNLTFSREEFLKKYVHKGQ